MIINSFEEALSAIGMRSADVEVPECDLTIKPTDNLRAPVGDCRIEGYILDAQAYILFE